MSQLTHPKASQEIALITDRSLSGSTTYFCLTRRAPDDTQRTPPFLSAPALLIQQIYEKYPKMARKILRNRIYTNVPLSESLRGIVKVAAKRITTNTPPESPVLQIPNDAIHLGELAPLKKFQIPTLSKAQNDVHAWMQVAFSLISDPSHEKLYLRDRPVAALLLSHDDRLLGAAVNTNASNRTQHAEMNLLRDHYEKTGKPLPRGAKVLTTLKPCKMCAGMIYDFMEPDVRVIFAHDDPGPNARMTALDCYSQIQSKL